MEQWISFISDVGFPIIVTLYLLHRIEAKLEAVIQSIHGLTEHRKAEAGVQVRQA
ncbi:YvrJ family protein [Jeotgalibacillus malaysiensis]|uniref:YvrJ family protein n=1 Tax=Jeotgalibacillus malaysiensis TaxID=1508404 RepID=UPI003850FAAB